jgi:hypothetical protein
MSFNQLTGTIPTELGQLVSLGRFEMHQKSLTGTIPSELGQLVSLEFLAISDMSDNSTSFLDIPWHRRQSVYRNNPNGTWSTC